jgi:hypothetical protein
MKTHSLYGIIAVGLFLAGPVARAATITVNSNGDSGAGTLRQAINDNNASSGGNTINFSVAGAVTLTSAKLLITKNVTITGPGARLLTVQRSTASGTPDFGIFQINAGTVHISGLTITNASGAPGLYNTGGVNVSVSDCTITGNNRNEVPGSPGQVGGGVFNQTDTGTVTLNNCTISNNTAEQGGGLDNQGIMILHNCTVANNSATTTSNLDGGGGGIINVGGTLTLVSCTISGNSSTTNSIPSGGGGVFASGTVHIGNTIVAGNSANQTGDDVRGPFASDGHNLIRNADGSTGFNQPGDQAGTAGALINANLGSLQNNGGPTDTKKPVSPSNAIDQGTSFGLTTDQRGWLRTNDNPNIPNAFQGDGTDIGAVETQPPTVLANISTRLRVETGDNVLIGGFIVTGTQPKKVIIRAIGPSLTLAGTLANPFLELRDSSGVLIRSNDNWRSDQETEIMATTIPPSNDLESAIVETLPANNSAYTATVRGANGGTGIGAVEVYDLNQAVDSKLANISTRGLVQTGDNVLIGGLIVLGQNPLPVIVRAIGPSLSVSGALGNPTLELHDGNGATIASNDNWRSDQEFEITATSIPPSNDLESAIVRSLAPGNYTAIVRGVNGTTGVALVEAYGLN